MSVRDLIKYSAVPAVIIDKNDLKIIYANEKAAVVTQWSSTKLSTKLLSDILNPVHGEPGDYTDVFLNTKKGDKHRIHVNIQAVIEYNYLLVSFWVTGFKEQETLENEINAWYRAFEKHSAPITIHAPNYELLDANEAACEAFGVPLEILVGKKCYELFHRKDSPAQVCPVKELIKSGNHTTRIVEFESLNERAIVDCSPVYDKNGRLEKVIHTAIGIDSLARIRQKLAKKKKEVHDKEEQYRAITQVSLDAIISLDENGKIVGWNPGARKIFGFLEEELLGKALSYIISKHYFKEHIADFENVSNHGKWRLVGKTVEVVALRKDETEFPAELSISECELNTGKFYLATVRDITSRRQQAEALRQERNFSEAVLESLPHIFYLFSYPKLRLQRWNKNHENLLGFSAEELKDRHVTEWFPAEIRSRVMEAMQLVIDEGQTTMDADLVAKDGHLIPCILTGVNIEIMGKQYIMGVGTDISLRKKAEEQLSKSEAQLRTLLNTMPDLVWLKDSDGIYLACNKSFEKYMNKTEEEIVGKTDFELIESERAKIFHKMDVEAMTKGEAIFSDEWTVVDNEGTRAFVETVKTPVHDANGKFMGVLGIGHDMTHRKMAEAEIKSKNQELTRINAEKNKFFSIIAHDLRNPLTSFMGLTQIMNEQIHDIAIDDLEEMIRSMKKSARNLFRLLENLLSWANMQQGLIPFKPDNISLSSLVSTVIKESARQPAKAKGIHIHDDIPPGINVFADKNMVQTVVRNLLSNAIKFTHKGGVISLDADVERHDFIEVVIRDSGVGMSKKMVQNLFVLNTNNNRPGTEGEPSTGLGLLLCEEFIKKHKGEIWVESEENKGSVFHFTLPKDEPSSE